MERTPKGVLEWPFITGQGKENYNRDGYIYTTDLILAGEAAESLKDDIKIFFKENFGAKANCKSAGYKELDDGTTRFTFKTGAKFKDGSPTKITTFNAAGSQFELGDVKIGNGSTGVVFFNMGAYTNGASKGVSLYLKAIQIANLVEYASVPAQAEAIEGDFENVSGSVPPVEVEGI